MALHILTRGKLSRIYYFIIQFNKKDKEIKNTEHHRHIGFPLLFIFSLDKWLPYAIPIIEYELCNFQSKIFISDYFCQYREFNFKKIQFECEHFLVQKR